MDATLLSTSTRKRMQIPPLVRSTVLLWYHMVRLKIHTTRSFWPCQTSIQLPLTLKIIPLAIVLTLQGLIVTSRRNISMINLK
jgi:hypothetical protein